MTAKTEPTMNLRFVKRRVGRNVVRILQQQWIDAEGKAVWQDVILWDEDGATKN